MTIRESSRPWGGILLNIHHTLYLCGTTKRYTTWKRLLYPANIVRCEFIKIGTSHMVHVPRAYQTLFSTNNRREKQNPMAHGSQLRHKFWLRLKVAQIFSTNKSILYEYDRGIWTQIELIHF